MSLVLTLLASYKCKINVGDSPYVWVVRRRSRFCMKWIKTQFWLVHVLFECEVWDMHTSILSQGLIPVEDHISHHTLHIDRDDVSVEVVFFWHRIGFVETDNCHSRVLFEYFSAGFNATHTHQVGPGSVFAWRRENGAEAVNNDYRPMAFNTLGNAGDRAKTTAVKYQPKRRGSVTSTKRRTSLGRQSEIKYAPFIRSVTATNAAVVGTSVIKWGEIIRTGRVVHNNSISATNRTTRRRRREGWAGDVHALPCFSNTNIARALGLRMSSDPIAILSSKEVNLELLWCAFLTIAWSRRACLEKNTIVNFVKLLCDAIPPKRYGRSEAADGGKGHHQGQKVLYTHDWLYWTILAWRETLLWDCVFSVYRKRVRISRLRVPFACPVCVCWIVFSVYSYA